MPVSTSWLHQVKRVADVGAPSDSRVVDGLVFRKNVVHKLMRTHISQPRIMMLGNMLEYHRTTGKLSSFDTLLEQVGPATSCRDVTCCRVTCITTAKQQALLLWQLV